MNDGNLNPAAYFILEALVRTPGATAEQLRGLASLRRPSERFVFENVGALLRAGLVQSVRLPAGRVRHYVPTKKALSRGIVCPDWPIPACSSTKPAHVLRHYHRAQLRLFFEEQGIDVLDDDVAVRALAEHLTQGVSERLADEIRSSLEWAGRASFVYRCGRCGFAASERFARHTSPASRKPCPSRLRAAPLLPAEVACAKNRPPTLLLVDNPLNSIQTQLERLPLRFQHYSQELRRVEYPPSLRVCFIPSDDGSVWDDRAGEWANRGPRLRIFESLVRPSTTGSRGHFPFHRTVEAVPPPAGVFFQRIPAQDPSPLEHSNEAG